MRQKGFIILFLLILLADLLALGFENFQGYRYATKPAITISLMFYVWFAGKNNGRLKSGLLLGLLCFLLGNIFMLFAGKEAWYFIRGLCTFLFGHLGYSYAFYHKDYLRHSKLEPSLIGLTLYILLIFYIIGESLGSLLPFVLLYMMGMLIFVLIAFIRLPFVNSKSGIWVLTGALLIVISATVLAIDKFTMSLPFSHFIILGSYGLGQLFLIIGGIEEEIQPI